MTKDERDLINDLCIERDKYYLLLREAETVLKMLREYDSAKLLGGLHFYNLDKFLKRIEDECGPSLTEEQVEMIKQAMEETPE